MASTDASIKITEKESKKKNELQLQKSAELVQPSGSENLLVPQENQATSTALLKTLSLELMILIKKVNENEVTPETVNSACNAASQIHKLLRLNLDMKKEGF